MSQSTAIGAQGTKFSIEGTPGSAINVTGVSVAEAAVFTGANTLVVGDAIEVGVIAGMEDLEGSLAVVTARTSGNFTTNLDTTRFASAGTTGTVVPKTWLPIRNTKDFQGFDGSVSDIEVTNLDSTAMEYRPGLEDFGSFSLNFDIDGRNAGQQALRTAKSKRQVKAMRLLVLDTGDQRLFKGYVKKMSEQGGVNGVIRGAADIKITGAVSFYDPALAGGGGGSSTGPLSPRFGLGAADAYQVANVAALFAAMTPFGANNSRAGTFALTTSAGNYGWVAVLASLTTSGLRFFDGTGYGGWSGAGLPGNNTGASPDPSTSTTTYTDGSGNVWRLFRQDYVNANPTPGSFTIS